MDFICDISSIRNTPRIYHSFLRITYHGLSIWLWENQLVVYTFLRRTFPLQYVYLVITSATRPPWGLIYRSLHNLLTISEHGSILLSPQTHKHPKIFAPKNARMVSNFSFTPNYQGSWSNTTWLHRWLNTILAFASKTPRIHALARKTFASDSSPSTTSKGRNHPSGDGGEDVPRQSVCGLED